MGTLFFLGGCGKKITLGNNGGSGSPKAAPCSTSSVLVRQNGVWTQTVLPESIRSMVEMLKDGGLSSQEIKKEILKNFNEIRIDDLNFDPIVRVDAQTIDWGMTSSLATSLWVSTTGNSGNNVAVIDTGIELGHNDLQANIFLPANSGWDVLNGDNDPSDENGHGTHVAGVIGAINNAIGVRGLNSSVTLLPIRVLDNKGIGTMGGVAAGVDLAVNAGAHFINLSLGSNAVAPAVLDQALVQAVDAGMVIVAAAGNSGINNDTYASYPANVNLEGMISVSAMSTPTQNLASWSQFGLNTVMLAAPGENIKSTYIGNTLTILSGTSMATPYVTGALALLRAYALTLPDPAYAKTIQLGALLRSALLAATNSRGLNVMTGGTLNIAAAAEILNNGHVFAGPHLARVRIGRKIRMAAAGGVPPYTFSYSSGDNLGTFQQEPDPSDGTTMTTFTTNGLGTMYYEVKDSQYDSAPVAEKPAHVFVGKLVSFEPSDLLAAGSCTP